MKTKLGPFPDALLLTDTTIGPWGVPLPQQLMAMPLDHPGPSRRDEILLAVKQRSIDAQVSATLDLGRVATVVRWLDSPPESFRFSRVLSVPDTGLAQLPGEAPSIDLLTMVHQSDVELLVSFEHWASGVRKHREVRVTDGQIVELRGWLYRFWADGFPDVVRRRGDESATEFAARRALARSGEQA